eukprot:CFRG5575T1
MALVAIAQHTHPTIGMNGPLTSETNLSDEDVITQAPHGIELGVDTSTATSTVLTQQQPSYMHVCDECSRLGYEERLPSMDNRNELLLWAARHGHAHHCRDLLYFTNEGHYSVHQTNCEGLTSLHLAARRGHIQVVKFLIEDACANVDQRTSVEDDALTALQFAACSNQIAVAELLLEYGANINARDRHGYTPVMFAAQFGHVAMVHLLIQFGADVYAEDEDGANALLWAADRGNGKVVDYLVNTVGMDVNMVDAVGMTPLHWAVYKNRVGVITQLLSMKGITVDMKDCEGNTPVMYAMQRKHHLALDCINRHVSGEGEPRWKLKWADMKRQSPAYLYPMICLPLMLSVSAYTRSLTISCVVNGCVMALMMLMSAHRFTHLVVGKGRDGNKRNPSQANLLLSILIINPVLYMTYMKGDDHLVTNMESTLTWAWVLFTVTFCSYCVCRSGDPGFLLTVKPSLFKTESGTPDKAYCNSCCIVKPQRATHCRYCNRCVARFDHHCDWTNNCVGEDNMSIFYVLLTSGAVVLYLYNQITAAYVFESVPEYYYGAELLHYGALSEVFAAQPIVTFSLMINTFAMYMVAALWLFHTYLVTSGITTNEYTNWHRYSYLKDSASGEFVNKYSKGVIGNWVKLLSFRTSNKSFQRMAKTV